MPPATPVVNENQPSCTALATGGPRRISSMAANKPMRVLTEPMAVHCVQDWWRGLATAAAFASPDPAAFYCAAVERVLHHELAQLAGRSHDADSLGLGAHG